MIQLISAKDNRNAEKYPINNNLYHIIADLVDYKVDHDCTYEEAFNKLDYIVTNENRVLLANTGIIEVGV